jgi:hypothetical protein
MKESRTYKGLWHLPEQPEKSVAGILYYNLAEKIKLELIGNIITEKDPILSIFGEDNKRPEMIYGESSDGKKITLLNCHSGKSSYNFSSSFPLTSFLCQYAIIGKHLISPEEKCFNKIKVLTPALPKWISSSLVKQKIGFEKDKITNFQLNIDQQSEVHSEFNISPDFKFTMISGVSMTGQEIFPDSVKISQLSFFHIENRNNKTTFFELLNLAGLFIQFLSLATNSDQYPIEIFLQDFDDYTLSRRTKRLNQTEVLLINHVKETKINSADFLFTYRDIKDDFESIIQKWYSSSKLLAPIRHHLLDSIIQKTTFKSIDFLIVVQALEGYHTRFINNDDSNLKQRLDELISRYSESVKKISEFSFNTQYVVNTRNYYSHFYKKDNRPIIEEGLELFKVTEELRMLLICCVLDLIGFSKDKINQIVNNI